jgi:translocation and assembly module TamB
MKTNPDRDRESHLNSGDLVQSSPRWWRKIFLGVAILFLGGTGGGLVCGWYLIQNKLIPVIETELTDYLHRPLELGDLEGLSPTSIRFGESKLPAIATNPDTVTTQAVKIDFNPLKFLWQRVLQLDVILIQPDVYIEQDTTGIWTPTKFGSESTKKKPSGGGLKIDVETIQFRQAELTLVARNKETEVLMPAVEGKIDSAIMRFLDRSKNIKFDVAGKLDRGGNFTVDGLSVDETGIIDLTLDADKLAATEVGNLLALPIKLQDGNVDGKLGIKLTGDPLPELTGVADIHAVSLQIPELVKPFLNSNGKLYFQGSKLEFQDISTNFGEVKGKVNGNLDLAGEGDYQIDTDISAIEIDRVIEALELEPPPIPLQGKIKGKVKVTGILKNPITSFDLVTTTSSKIDRLIFEKITANLDIIGNTLSVRQFQALPETGGKFWGDGKLQLDGNQNLVFNVRTKNVSSKAIAKSYDNKLPVDIDRISGATKISALAGKPETFRINDGVATFALGNGIVNLDGIQYADGKWQSQLETVGVEFGSLPFGKGSTPTISKGLVDGKFQAFGKPDFDLNKVRADGAATLTTVGGKILLPTVKLARGIWQADTKTSNLKLRRLFPEVPTEFNDNLSGNIYLTGEVQPNSQGDTIINGFGDLNLAQGTVKISDLKIVGDNWSAIAQGNNLQLKQLSSTTPEQFAGTIDGTLKLAGTIDNITPQGIIANGNGSLTLPEGVFTAHNLAIAQGKFKTQIVPENVDLSLFADPNSDDLKLTGKLSGELTATGLVDKLDPTAVNAAGTVYFSEGIDFLELPLTATINWNGKKLNVWQATGEGLEAKGYIDLDNSFFKDIPDKLAAVKYFEFDVPQAEWLDITKLRIPLPSWAVNLDYSGRADFVGRIKGIPAAMDIDGSLDLRHFRVENITFAPILSGFVRIDPANGANLQLSESGVNSQERIELVLDRNFSPLAFVIKRDEIEIVGKGQQEIVQIQTKNVPLDLLKTVAIKSPDLNIPKNLAAQPVEGELTGDFTTNLNTLATSGENITIAAPILGRVKGDSLIGDFQYSEGYFALQNVKFQQRDSIYQIAGELVQKTNDLELDGSISIDRGQIQDVLIALEIFEFSDFQQLFSDRDYAKSADLYESKSPQPPLYGVGVENTPILRQLERLAQIQTRLIELQQQQQSSLLPELKNLQGTFDGKVSVSGSLNAGIDAAFDFVGKQWQWGDIKSPEIIARGDLTNNILTLLPISIRLQAPDNSQAKESLSPLIILSGSFGESETRYGQLQLSEIPVALIEQVVALPPEIAFGGTIDANASIAGNLPNPQARGEIEIANASINQTSVKSTTGSFNYKNSRLTFFANSNIAANAEPLTITGSIPYQLPFAKTPPDSDRLNLQLNVKNRGFELLDILSRGEIAWIDGKGELDLHLNGIFDRTLNIPRQLEAQGTAKIEKATIAAKTLPNAPLTDVNGNIFFDLDSIQVETLQGNFGGGKISVIGDLPLTDKTKVEQPLDIDLDNLAIDLKGLYEGGVKGKLQILGTATEPDITGKVTLSEGTILLGDTTATETSTVSDAPVVNNLDKVNNLRDRGLPAVTEYKNLQLTLGDNIQIGQPPIFTFVATGNLKVNGTFESPSPEGTIRLQRGQVNLFTTQLNLSRDYQNKARFSTNNGLDPYLDVLLVGSALETTNSGFTEDPLSSEISDIPASSFGSLETVRISARVKGLASQITNKIELTSSPPRSQTEILGLLGGSFVNTLGRGGSPLGLANLAGSAIFGSLNAQFNRAFPLGELRLFPTQIIDDNRERDRIDALAGELAIDVFKDFSLSAIKILNVDIPAQFGFRYRINDNFVLRGSTNFEDESRGVVEYELRF